MATADFELSMTLKGSPEELQSLLEIFKSYADGKNGVNFSSPNVKSTSEDTVDISALGPYGRYSELNDVALFREMAEAAPCATFKAEISGTTTYTQQSLNCELSNRLLHITTYFESNDDISDQYVDYFKKKIPYKKFIKMFKLDRDEFDEETYEEFISDTLVYGDAMTEMDYDELMENLGVDSELDEDEYEKVMDKLRAIPVESFDDFRENNEAGEKQTLRYDPIAKAYVGNEMPKIARNIPFDATDELNTYLKENSFPYDDKSVENLSIEDAYAIMAGICEEDIEDDDFDEES